MATPLDRRDDDLPDHIVDEIRNVRAAHAASLGFDITRIVADLKARDAKSGDRLVSLPPKPVRRRRVAVGE